MEGGIVRVSGELQVRGELQEIEIETRRKTSLSLYNIYVMCVYDR